MYRIVFLLAVIGVAAAFFRPAGPNQIPRVVQQENNVVMKKNMAFVDTDLDNIAVESDSNIHPARKCGFCMGWAGQTNCPVSGL